MDSFSHMCSNNMLAPCTREGENGSFNLFNTNMLCTLQCVSLFAASVPRGPVTAVPKGADRVTADDSATGSSHPIMSESSRMILRSP